MNLTNADTDLRGLCVCYGAILRRYSSFYTVPFVSFSLAETVHANAGLVSEKKAIVRKDYRTKGARLSCSAWFGKLTIFGEIDESLWRDEKQDTNDSEWQS